MRWNLTSLRSVCVHRWPDLTNLFPGPEDSASTPAASQLRGRIAPLRAPRLLLVPRESTALRHRRLPASTRDPGTKPGLLQTHPANIPHWKACALGKRGVAPHQSCARVIARLSEKNHPENCGPSSVSLR